MYKKQIPYKRFVSWQTKMFQESCETSLNYRGATVNNIFKDMKIFMSVIYKVYYEIEGEQMCMTNKLLSKDNRYDKNTICFLPRSIIQFLNNLDVYKIEFKPSTKTYKAFCTIKGNTTCKEFKSKQSAKKWIKTQKGKFILEFVKSNKDVLPMEVSEALGKLVTK